MKNQFLKLITGLIFIFAIIGCEPAPPAEWPDAPRGVRAERYPDDESETINITWNKVIGAVGYYVYFSDTGYGEYDFDGYTDTTSFFSEGKYLRSDWYFKVKSVNSEGEPGSKFSSPAMVPRVEEAIYPEAPVGVNAVRDTDYPSIVNISWDRVIGADGYNVYYSDTGKGEGNKDNLNLITATSFKSYENDPDKGWYFRVVAVKNGTGEGNTSSWVPVPPDINPFLGTWSGYNVNDEYYDPYELFRNGS